MSKATKKEKSRYKSLARKKRKENAQARKSAKPKEEKKNPISVEITEEGNFVFHGRSFNSTQDKNKALVPYNKQIWSRGQRLHILPTEDQKVLIHKTNGCARVVKNDYRQKRIERYENDHTTLSVAEYKKSTCQN